MDDDPVFRDPKQFDPDPENDFRIRKSSPCIDMGDNNVPDLPPEDLDGTERIYHGVVDIGVYEFECLVDDDCHDADVCTFDECVGGFCQDPPAPNIYGDVDHNGTVNIFDIFRVLDGFSGDFSLCSFESVDIAPCQGDCDDPRDGIIDGDGDCVVNVSDLFAVLDGWVGIDPCCTVGVCCFEDDTCQELTGQDCILVGGRFQRQETDCASFGCDVGACCFADDTCEDLSGWDCAEAGGAYQGEQSKCDWFDCSTRGAGGEGGGSMGQSSSGGGAIQISLLTKENARSAEGVYDVEVFASDFVDLRGYEVAVEVVGGETGILDLEDLYIGIDRKEFVFAGQESYHAVDMANGRMVCALPEGGVSSKDALYLGTFVLRAGPESRGTFQVIPRTGDGTILLDSSGRRLEIVDTTEAAISVK